MADPSISSEPGKFQEVAKAAAELQQAVEGHTAYLDLEQQLEEARAMLKESQGEFGRPSVLDAALLWRHRWRLDITVPAGCSMQRPDATGELLQATRRCWRWCERRLRS